MGRPLLRRVGLGGWLRRVGLASLRSWAREGDERWPGLRLLRRGLLRLRLRLWLWRCGVVRALVVRKLLVRGLLMWRRRKWGEGLWWLLA